LIIFFIQYNRFEQEEPDCAVSLLDINNVVTSDDIKQLQWWRQYIGLTLALIASFSFALNSLISKVIVGKYNVFFVSFVRVQGVFFPALAFMLHARFIKKEQIFERLLPLAENRLAVAALIVRNILNDVADTNLYTVLQYVQNFSQPANL
jgi:drug/metabolite transporter (DMT)-like permease